MGMPHLKKKALSIVTPAIHKTVFCGLSRTVLGGDDCGVLMAVTMQFSILHCDVCTSYISTKTQHYIPENCNSCAMQLVLKSYCYSATQKNFPLSMESRQRFISVFTCPYTGLVETSPYSSVRVSRSILKISCHRYLCFPHGLCENQKPSWSYLSSVWF